MDRKIRIPYKTTEQGLVVSQPSTNGRLVIQPGVVIAIEKQAFIGFHYVQEEIEIDISFPVGVDLGLQTGELHAGSDTFQIELHFHKRQPAEVTLQRQLPNDGAVRVGLMVVCVQYRAFLARQQLRESHPLRHARADWQEVDTVSYEGPPF